MRPSLLALAAAPLLLFIAPSPSSQQTGFVGFPPELSFQREPTLIYDLTGSTLIGLFHTNLVVYNDGMVSYSQRSESPVIFVPDGTGEACTVMVPPLAARGLTRALLDAGASTLGDSPLLISDVPLQTVTFMVPGTDAKAHTFSFFGGDEGHNAVSMIINAFISEHVPFCPSSEF